MSHFIFALAAAWIVAMIIIKAVIPTLVRLKFGQNIREEGPESHQKKSGTPTMGGIAFILTLILSMLFLGNYNATLLLTVGITCLYGILGFCDDFIKTVKKRNLGLRAWQKMAGEIFLAALLLLGACLLLQRGTDLSIFNHGTIKAGVFFYIIAFILIAGVTNGVNLNDGLDGLAAGVSFFVYLGYGLIAMHCIDNPPFPGVDYFVLMVFAAAMAGICLAFLFYNHYPAKVFMGDTGSLFLGGGLAVLSILTGQELLLIIMGGVYVIEAASVMIQVASFKTRGKRVFLMTPIHHHFELKGWKETKVVYTFWAASLCFTALALLIYFI